MKVIESKDLVKIYNADTSFPVKAVNGVSLNINKGEFIAIIGPSGSGKSTLLNLIGGLDRPTSGTIAVQGQNLAELSDSQLIKFRKNHIGFVFQSFNLIPVLTTQENIEFVMNLQGISKEKRLERTKELVVQVGLEDKIDKRPTELSGGQQQRVAVARALAPKPAFILADEPTANLDSASAFALLDLMATLNREEETTFIFSTHDQRVIDRVQRVITLIDGRIESDERKK